MTQTIYKGRFVLVTIQRNGTYDNLEKIPHPDFMGTGMALQGYLKKKETLEEFNLRYRDIQRRSRITAEKVISSFKKTHIKIDGEWILKSELQ